MLLGDPLTKSLKPFRSAENMATRAKKWRKKKNNNTLNDFFSLTGGRILK